MLELQLRQQLSVVGRRIGRLWMWRRLTWLWVALSALVAVWAVAGRPIVPAVAWVVAAGLIAASVWYRSRSLAMTKSEVARRIEHAFPDLKSRLLAAIEQHPDIQTGRLNVLQRQVISEAVHHARMNDWSDSIPRRLMTRAIVGQIVALISFVTVGFVAMNASSNSVAATSKLHSTVAISRDALPINVEPGNAELERGTSLLVLARFTGQPPADVNVIWKGSDEIEHRLSLAKSLDDPVFAVRLPALKEDITYRIDFDERQTADYHITVYDLPALVRSDLRLEFPSYTNLEQKLLENAFEATVVEGTQVTIICNVNKPLLSADLIASDKTVLHLHSEPANPTTWQVQLTPTRRMRLKLDLLDDSGRKNRDSEEFRIDVVPNKAPELKLVFPGKDVKVSPLEEIIVEATVIDDFAVVETGLTFQAAGREPIKTILGKDLKGGEQHKLQSIQRLEDFRVQPDELVTYYVYAIDIGPDGTPRQTNSDVFFAEVRAFDEIYRQIDQQGEGEMQSAQKPPDSLVKLLELQKQIIVATWKLARIVNPTWAANTTEQIRTIDDSQLQAKQKLQSLRERMTQPQLQPIFATIVESMDTAQRELDRSLDERSFAPLSQAISGEQSAYQGLLKLRAKEHLLMQSKAKGNGQENEEKEKLDLELKRKENRYESEKKGAKKEESNVNREALAILDRLKELATRQDGINQQLKELESQMRQAKNEAEREEIERRLKRLREEQEQLLHDADELRNKLNKSSQTESIAETRQQLEQTRQGMVDTVEKLREGQLSKALASGTARERELKQIHEDFRKQTAAQFADEMRSLREEVRLLADREKQLAEQLTQLGDDSRRTLRQTQERTQLQSEFQQQRQQANEIVEKAKQVVEQSETSEPLLSKQLYDTLRSTRESQVDQALNATRQLLQQGVVAEATKAEQQARTGIERLKQGIERAAESVLGNEVDSLKRARRELAELSRQLDEEIRTQDPNTKTDPTGQGLKPNPGKTGQGNDSDHGSNGQGKSDQGKDGANDKNADGSGSDKTGKGVDPKGKAGSEGRSADSGNEDSGDGNAPGGQGSKSKGKGQGEGQGEGTGQGSGDGSGEGDSANGTSDASSKTAPLSARQDQQSGQKGPLGLRKSSKSGSNSRPAQGRSEGSGENSESGGSAGNAQGGGPLTGGNFTEFNERLRDVESMIGDPQLQAEVQKVRDRARSARAEFKRHTQTPNWDLVRTSVHQPMIELQQRLAEEIAKRESPDSLIPVDRDPVPTRYRDLVRSYYERLGSGREE